MDRSARRPSERAPREPASFPRAEFGSTSVITQLTEVGPGATYRVALIHQHGRPQGLPHPAHVFDRKGVLHFTRPSETWTEPVDREQPPTVLPFVKTDDPVAETSVSLSRVRPCGDHFSSRALCFQALCGQ